MPNLFQRGMSEAERAHQAWSILISKAANRQTITYKELDTLMNYGTAQLGGVLSYIKAYCMQEKLPILSYLVVNKGKGEPGGSEQSSPQQREEILKLIGMPLFLQLWTNSKPPKRG